MNQAAATRGRRGAQPEYHTGDMQLGQPSPILLPDDDRELAMGAILPVESSEGADYAAQLAFMEEPVTIRIEPSSERNAARSIFCSVNGSGAEVRTEDGKWIKMNYLPVGTPLTTKRKYVEVLARAKHMSIEHTDSGAGNGDPENYLVPRNSSVAPFSVIRDENPKGYEWLTKLLAGSW